jgi:plastocyanin
MTDELKFEPETVTISTGDTVQWRNDGNVAHIVTAYESELPNGADYFASGGFRSEQAARKNLSDGLVDPGEQFEHTFDTAGVCQYYCIPHESAGMTGSVQVE